MRVPERHSVNLFDYAGTCIVEIEDDDTELALVNPDILRDMADAVDEMGIDKARLFVEHPSDAADDAPDEPLITLVAEDGQMGAQMAPVNRKQFRADKEGDDDE